MINGTHDTRVAAPLPPAQALTTLSGTAWSLQPARIASTGPHYTLVELADRRKVRVEQLHGPLAIGGDVFVAGPIEVGAYGLEARVGWCVTVPSPAQPAMLQPPAPSQLPAPPPATARRLAGEVTRVHPSGAFGSVTADHGAGEYFVHQSELQGAPLMPGLRLTFDVASASRGPKAVRCLAI